MGNTSLIKGCFKSIIVNNVLLSYLMLIAYIVIGKYCKPCFKSVNVRSVNVLLSYLMLISYFEIGLFGFSLE